MDTVATGTLGRRCLSRNPACFTIGDREIDLVAHAITDAGRRINLTQTECALLEQLGRRLNQTVPSQELVDLIWGRHPTRGSHSLRSLVKNVRRKLEPDPAQPRYLVLDRAIGYRLEGSIE